MTGARRTIFFLIGIALSAVALILWWPHLGGRMTEVIGGAPLAMFLHVAGAALMGVGAGRGGLGLLFAVMALVLPVFGGLAVLGVSWLLGIGGTVEEDVEEFDFGNPVMSRSNAGSAEVEARPVGRLMREESAGEIGRMILGLSKCGGAERGHQVLRRYQQDGDVELQFYAQNAQRGSTEVLEGQLKRLRDRIEGEPDNPALGLALAEVLIELAGCRTTSGSDAHAYVRRALELLKPMPENSKRAALEVRGNLTLGEAAGARKALAGLAEGDVRRGRLEAEVCYAERDWKRLAGSADELSVADIEARTAIAFWKEGV